MYRATRNDESAPDRPLFGEARSRDKLLNLVVVFITFVIAMETLVVPIVHKPVVIHILLAAINVLFFFSHATLVYWYRQGDLDPKFRKLIIYNGFLIITFCVGLNALFFM